MLKLLYELRVTVLLHPGRWELMPMWGHQWTWLCVTVIATRHPAALNKTLSSHRRGAA